MLQASACAPTVLAQCAPLPALRPLRLLLLLQRSNRAQGGMQRIEGTLHTCDRTPHSCVAAPAVSQTGWVQGTLLHVSQGEFDLK